jgi:hypothetical protein
MEVLLKKTAKLYKKKSLKVGALRLFNVVMLKEAFDLIFCITNLMHFF